MKKLVSVALALCLAFSCSLGAFGQISPGLPPADYSWISQGKTPEKLLTPESGGEIDLRSADLCALDLSDKGEALQKSATFDSKTKWPESLPAAFSPGAILRQGKDPGLGVRTLHRKKLTGKGVGIGIIDQPLLTGHIEYADRLRYYEQLGTPSEEQATMHGAAVASLALGKTVGVAPEALLYYISADPTIGNASHDWQYDLRDYARAIDKFVALNQTLAEDEKIRVISISLGWDESYAGFAEIQSAIVKARASGIAVLSTSMEPLSDWFFGMSRRPLSNPNKLSSLRPGLFWEQSLYAGQMSRSDYILLPMDYRTTASPTGERDYVHYVVGGLSWSVPYAAGLYALACQAVPGVSMEQFIAAAKKTADPVSTTNIGKQLPYGKAINPAAVITELKKARAR